MMGKGSGNSVIAVRESEIPTGDASMAQLAAHYDVHANQITSWKTPLLENAANVGHVGGGMGFSDNGKLLIKKMLGPNYAARRLLAYELAHGEPEIALIPILCTRDADFLDVGANVGVYSFYA